MNASGVILAAAEDALRKRRLDHAMILLGEAEAEGAEPDRCAAGRWMVYMLRGAFEQAWKESDAIGQRNASDPHRLWQGESIAGSRVMVRCLHGFGDAVQMLRYVPKLRELAEHVTVQVAPRFTELAACFAGVDEVITWGEAAATKEPDWDVQVEIMELPYIFRTQMSDLPVRAGYLQLPGTTKLLQKKRGRCLQIGVVSTAGEWNASRSIPLATLKSLFEVRGCEFWNLQTCKAPLEQAELLEDEDCRDSIMGLAERIAALDLVITVDTLAAHLAGALNVPTWVMLHYEADWRWMHLRDKSPWYPSHRLFRQAKEGEWDGMAGSVRDALQETAQSHSEQKMVA